MIRTIRTTRQTPLPPTTCRPWFGGSDLPYTPPPTDPIWYLPLGTSLPRTLGTRVRPD